MPENVKLKDLYGDEKTYNGITAVEIPKASGDGNATFIEPPTSQFMLRETTYQEDYVQYSGTTIAISGISADSMTVIRIRNSSLHIDKSKIVMVGSLGNQGAPFSVFHSLESMSITEFMTRILQEEENEEVVVVPDTYSVSPGWTSIKYSTTKEGNTRRVSIESFSPIDDPSSVVFVAQMPWNIMSGKENYFYSYITEATQQVKSVEITKNGDLTVIPDLGKSGITELKLGVNVPTTDFSVVTATTADVLKNKSFFDSSGNLVQGTIIERDKTPVVETVGNTVSATWQSGYYPEEIQYTYKKGEYNLSTSTTTYQSEDSKNALLSAAQEAMLNGVIEFGEPVWMIGIGFRIMGSWLAAINTLYADQSNGTAYCVGGVNTGGATASMELSGIIAPDGTLSYNLDKLVYNGSDVTAMVGSSTEMRIVLLKSV